MRRRKLLRGLFFLAVTGAALYALRDDGASLFGTLPGAGTSESAQRSGEGQILEAFQARRSNVDVEVAGWVQRILDDDTRGSRHQRFILELPSSNTVLVSHNIDLAPRVPIRIGDGIELRGEYEWNERGGVVHWTHHDPGGARDGGWIRHDGRTYR